MTRRLLVSAVLAALTIGLVPSVATASPARTASARVHVVRFDGVGKLTIGMKASKLRKLGYRSDGGRDGCRFYDKDNGYSLIVSPERRLISISTYPHRNLRTKAGIRPGSTLAKLKRAYRNDHIEYHLDRSFGQGGSGVLVRRHGRWLGFSLDDRTHRVVSIQVGLKRLVTDAEVYC